MGVGVGVGVGGGGGVASGIHIPNLLTNYPMKIHKIKTMCYTPEYMSNFRCIIIT